MSDLITYEKALSLFRNATLLELGDMANSIRKKLHPENIVSFVVDRNVNYTNICTSECKFCAFYKKPGDKDGYILTIEEILQKIEELVNLGGTQLLMQGGLNPELKIDFFENMFRKIKEKFPNIQNHSLSPAEIITIAKNSDLTIKETLTRLKDSGLNSVPGGGAEILVDDVRNKISPNKIGWQKWKEVMMTAASLSMNTTATMMFGSIEKDEDIITHIFRIKEMQEEGASFTAFIPWTFQPTNTNLSGKECTGVEYLKVVAISRIILHNVKNIQASWVTQGAKVAQTSLFFGANDLGGTMLEENVVAATGCKFRMSKEEIIDLAKNAGFRAFQRDTKYNMLVEY